MTIARRKQLESNSLLRISLDGMDSQPASERSVSGFRVACFSADDSFSPMVVTRCLSHGKVLNELCSCWHYTTALFPSFSLSSPSFRSTLFAPIISIAMHLRSERKLAASI